MFSFRAKDNDTTTQEGKQEIDGSQEELTNNSARKNLREPIIMPMKEEMT